MGQFTVEENLWTGSGGRGGEGVNAEHQTTGRLERMYVEIAHEEIVTIRIGDLSRHVHNPSCHGVGALQTFTCWT